MNAEANWAPLESFADRVATSSLPLGTDDFMSMGRIGTPSTGPIELYKHRGTRRYLNLDEAGHGYRFERGRYEAWHSPARAIAEVTGVGVAYRCWTNLDGGFSRSYEPGDRLVRGWAT